MPRVSSDKERAETVIEVAEEIDADHLFTLGQKRFPTGKALVGNIAQYVVLNFNGYVTLNTQ